MDKMWKHDKFQTVQPASQPPPVGSYYRPAGQPVPAGDFYRPATKSEPSRQIKETGGSARSDAPSTYIPQDTLILRKAARLSITAEQVKSIIDKFNADVRLRHSNKIVNPQWLLWKEQSLTWNYLCECLAAVLKVLY